MCPSYYMQFGFQTLIVKFIVEGREACLYSLIVRWSHKYKKNRIVSAMRWIGTGHFMYIHSGSHRQNPMLISAYQQSLSSFNSTYLMHLQCVANTVCSIYSPTSKV